MFTIYTVSFFGHRILDNFSSVEDTIYEIVKALVKKEIYTEFLVGRNGDFDRLVSSTIVRAKGEFDQGNNRHICVLPYPIAEYQKNQRGMERYYDEVLLPVETFPKGAIQARNRWMVDNSDLCVFCVDRKEGGAWETLRYALQQKKRVVNTGRLRLSCRP